MRRGKRAGEEGGSGAPLLRSVSPLLGLAASPLALPVSLDEEDAGQTTKACGPTGAEREREREAILLTWVLETPAGRANGMDPTVQIA